MTQSGSFRKTASKVKNSHLISFIFPGPFSSYQQKDSSKGPDVMFRITLIAICVSSRDQRGQ